MCETPLLDAPSFSPRVSVCLLVASVWLLRRRDLHRLVPQHVLQLQRRKPQHRALLCALLLLHHHQRQGSLPRRRISTPSIVPTLVSICTHCCCCCPPGQGIINTMCGRGMQELEYSEAGEHIHASGCIDTLVNWIHSNLFLLGGIALGLAIPQVQCTLESN